MIETAREWLRKAEAGYGTARREFAVSTDPNYDAVCFHAQHGAEKILKTVLIARSITPPRTHDLVQLCQRVAEIEPSFLWSEDDLLLLGRGAIDFRYPGETATLEEARSRLEIAERLRLAALRLLPTDPVT